MKPRYQNSKRDEFLSAIITTSLDASDCDINRRCKFNFSYFDVQPAGQNFADWKHGELVDLLEKLKDYSRESLAHWMRASAGKHGKVLSIYKTFPAKSDFSFPRHVPHQVLWGRFRLDWAARLVGFIVPGEYAAKERQKDGSYFDCNTFYVVFLDQNHRFYKTETK